MICIYPSSYDNVSSSKCIQHILMFYLDCMLEVGVGGGGGRSILISMFFTIFVST